MQPIKEASKKSNELRLLYLDAENKIKWWVLWNLV